MRATVQLGPEDGDRAVEVRVGRPGWVSESALPADLAAVFEAVPVGIVIAEAPSGRLVAGNAQAERILGTGDVGYASVESQDAFGELVALLPDRLRRIIEMRFVNGMKQSEIAAAIGVSQVQVSRLLRQATDRLRPQLEHRNRLADVPA